MIKVDTTKVSIKFTIVKMYSENVNSVVEKKVLGQLTITEAKNYARDNHMVYISKEHIKESFNVDSQKLLDLCLGV